ncbi:MAG TPA: PQQ-dependent sugar dehydrogenase, partial [Verrucomicrobiae bacterium]|nr:PQQ-dependent sugar dehydrogenase [Verrucomicrobiae bacterium]
LAPAHGADSPVPRPAQAATRPLQDYRNFAMGHDGNAARGRDLFNNEQRGACSKCHSVDGGSSKAGPDLFAVGDKFPRRELIRAVLEPSADIAIGYGTTIVETKDGNEVQGVLKGATPEALELMGADGKRITIARRDIKEQRGSTLSLMPEGLQAGISQQEFTDLIEYLVTLKQPESALTSNRGMPDRIPELAKPIEVRPFFSEQLRFPHAFVHKPGDVRFGLVWFGQLPGVSNTFLAVHQTGKIWRLEKSGTNETKTLFADISKDIFNERGPNGLLGLAFHPKFRENRRYFLKHQVYEDAKIVTTAVERQAAPDLRTDSGRPSRRLWQVPSTTQDHSGGCLGFGPDGFLYIAMGDTGPQQDPHGHGQDLTTHLGKILRIDVDHADAGLAYAIPADNPFRDRPEARPEIWAYGFREPWRFSFDRVTRDLWVGDVGQDRVEEAAIVRRGENHGWNVYEGFEPFSNRYRKDGATYAPPVFAYRRKFGNSITGGYVYRGDPRSSFYGVYICGDYTSHRIWGVTQEGRVLKTVRQIGTAPQGIASFAQDDAGNLYVVGYEGMVYQLDFSETAFEPVAESASAPAPASAVTPAPAAREGSVAWARHAVSLPESIWSVAALDANCDGRLDLIAMGETKVFVLLAPDWRPQVLIDTKEPKMLYCVAFDADQDGDLDLAIGRYRVPWIEYRQARAAGTNMAEPKGPDFSIAWLENTGRVGDPWPLHVLDREFNGIHGLWVGDVNGDGLKDLLADSIMGPLFPKSLAWFQGPPRGTHPFQRHLITTGGADGRPHYLDFADLNGDGRGDVLVGDAGGGTFSWWEQGRDRQGDEQPWTKHVIAKENGATNVRAADVNADGVLDVVASCGHGTGVFWFEGPAWQKHVIDGDLRDPHALAVGDFDGDGDPDVAVASFGAKLVRWYENLGRGSFALHDIDTTNRQEAYDLKVVDLDGDGRLDLILAGRETRNVVWYRNRPPE